jgi:membrane protein YqaA with SNARE-associated domain
MADASLKAPEPAEAGDTVCVRGWFAAYGLLVAAAAAPLAVLVAREPWSWQDWTGDWDHLQQTFRQTGPAVKLLGLGLYLSLCCTFLPLPTGWIVAAVATRSAAVGPGLWTTALLVAGVGGAASTVGNLNDYHLFTWMLRSRRIATIRRTRAVRAAARWFARAPFLILLVFNVIPIPVDVIRMLATTYRYPRVPFAAANFLGRFVRYGVIAAVTYLMGPHGWVAAAALLGLAVVLGAARVGPAAWRKLRRPPQPQAR